MLLRLPSNALNASRRVDMFLDKPGTRIFHSILLNAIAYVLRISNIIHIYSALFYLHPLLTCALVHAEETLSEGHVERVDSLRLSAALLQISDRFPSTGPATATLLVVAFDPV